MDELASHLFIKGPIVSPTKLRHPSEAAGTTAGLPMISSKSFFTETDPPKWLVRDVMVVGQFAVIGGPLKSLMTPIGLDLGLSVASGTDFLNTFPVPSPARVGFFSCEFARGTVRETAERICRTKGIAGPNLNIFWSFGLPRLDDDAGLDQLRKTISTQGLRLVLIDQLHACLIRTCRVNPSNIFEISPIVARVIQACVDCGATLVVTHHARKNARVDPGGPLDLEDLAQCGIAEAARQWILLNPRSPFVPGRGTHQMRMSIGGSAGFSSLWDVSVDEGQPGPNLDQRTWFVEVRPFSPGPKSARCRSSGSRSEFANPVGR